VKIFAMDVPTDVAFRSRDTENLPTPQPTGAWSDWMELGVDPTPAADGLYLVMSMATLLLQSFEPWNNRRSIIISCPVVIGETLIRTVDYEVTLTRLLKTLQPA
jgi:hypothetical protein